MIKMSFEGEAIEATLATGKLNYDRDVMIKGAAISRHGALLPEILCRFENCKAFCRLDLSGIKSPPILVHSQYIPVAMPCLPIF
jgi:hypothetical protein